MVESTAVVGRQISCFTTTLYHLTRPFTLEWLLATEQQQILIAIKYWQKVPANT